jgi:hypothetical protein
MNIEEATEKYEAWLGDCCQDRFGLSDEKRERVDSGRQQPEQPCWRLRSGPVRCMFSVELEPLKRNSRLLRVPVRWNGARQI